jgi:hypothetical protein
MSHAVWTGQIGVDRDVADAALLLGEEHLLAPISAEDGRLERAVIFLVDEGVCRLLAEDARVLDALLLDRFLGHCARHIDGQHLREPILARLSHVQHAFRVVATANRGDEERPAAVLDHDRREIGPRGGVAQRPLAERDAIGRRADCGVVAIGAEHLPRCPILEADEHLLLIRVGAQLVREGLVDAALARVRIDGRPNGLAALAVRGEHVPISRRLVDHTCRSPVQANIVLSRATVPNADGPLAAVLQVSPDAPLIRPRSPIVRNADCLRHCRRPWCNTRARPRAERLCFPPASRAAVWPARS